MNIADMPPEPLPSEMNIAGALTRYQQIDCYSAFVKITLRHSLISQSDAKSKPIASSSLAFSRAKGRSRAYAFKYD